MMRKQSKAAHFDLRNVVHKARALMMRPGSLNFRLSLVFLFFFLLVTVLGLFSIEKLSQFNQSSADIRDLWLPNTRYIGDLNNFTSDFRAAEGRRLLSSTSAEGAATEKEMAQLDELVARAQQGYESLRHQPVEGGIYAQFKEKWIEYRKDVDQVLHLSATDHNPEAIMLYRTTSQASYNAASDTLDRLTDLNVAVAGEASNLADQVFQEARRFIGLAMLAAAALVIAALLYVRRSISGPLFDLANCMHRLAGNDTDIDIRGTERTDEIGEMSRAVLVFRNNAVALILSQHALAQQASMLEEKLAQEKRLTQLQQDFVSMASHEFRTPLTVIDGQAQRLAKISGHVRPHEVVERAGQVRRAVLRMTTLIDYLLNSSRLVEGDAQLYFHPAEIDLRSVLREVFQLHREIAPRCQICDKLGTAPLRLFGDSKLLFQMFSNLIGNAIKYSPNGGVIEVSAEIKSGCVAVAIQDHGIGIPEKDLEHVFGRHNRGSNISGIVGTGVGLYLVKMVVDLHGGDISVESKEGEGSRFSLRLPIMTATLENQVLSLDSTRPRAAGDNVRARQLVDEVAVSRGWDALPGRGPEAEHR